MIQRMNYWIEKRVSIHLLTCPTTGNLSINKLNTWGGSVCPRTCNSCWGWPQTLTALAMWSTHSFIFPCPNNSSPSWICEHAFFRLGKLKKGNMQEVNAIIVYFFQEERLHSFVIIEFWELSTSSCLRFFHVLLRFSSCDQSSVFCTEHIHLTTNNWLTLTFS